MSDNGRISLIFLLNLLLYFLIGELNFLVGSLAIHLHLDALLILFLGLYLSRVSSLVYTALLGFLADALHPSPAGVYVAGYLFLWLFFVWFHRRIRRQNTTHVRSLAASAQAIWILAMAFILGGEQLQSMAYWSRILSDLIASSAIVYFLAWPWCEFQKHFLYNIGWDLEAQMPHL